MMNFDIEKLLKPSTTHAGRIDWVKTGEAIEDYFAYLKNNGEITPSEFSESVDKIPQLLKSLKRRKHYIQALKRQGKMK